MLPRIHAVTTAAAMALVMTAANTPMTSQAPAIRPFRIEIGDDALRDLKERLTRTRYPDSGPGAPWEYGTDLTYLSELVAYWLHQFDWRAAERRLNQFDQFMTTIDGVDIHFIHQKSPHPNAMPLALTHGWPGSIAEFTKVIGPLTDPPAHGGSATDAFHVVAISLPGFGFSGKPREPGFSPERMGRIIATLMARLGYERYGLQGGDWGGVISRLVAINDAPHVAGLHLNFCIAGAAPGSTPNDGVTPAELALMEERQAYMANERAYQQIQGTKPQTLG
jgi:hypothetical protein